MVFPAAIVGTRAVLSGVGRKVIDSVGGKVAARVGGKVLRGRSKEGGPSRPPRLRYRLPGSIMLPILILVFLVEAAQIFFFAALVFGPSLMLASKAESGVVVTGKEADCAGPVSCWWNSLWEAVDKVWEHLKQKAWEFAMSLSAPFLVAFLAALTAAVTFMGWIALTLIFVGVALLCTLRGVSVWEIFSRRSMAYYLLLLVKLIPYASSFVPSMTIWLWLLWRRVSEEDEKAYQKQLREWEAQLQARQAEARNRLQWKLQYARAPQEQLVAARVAASSQQSGAAKVGGNALSPLGV